MLGIAAGDWLQACAGFVGVIFTIAAAVWIERRRDRKDAKAGLNRLDRALVELREAATAAATVKENTPHATALPIIMRMVDARQRAVFLFSRMEIDDFDFWSAATFLRDSRPGNFDGMQEWAQTNFEGANPHALATAIESIAWQSGWIIRQIEAARAALAKLP